MRFWNTQRPGSYGLELIRCFFQFLWRCMLRWSGCWNLGVPCKIGNATPEPQNFTYWAPPNTFITSSLNLLYSKLNIPNSFNHSSEGLVSLLVHSPFLLHLIFFLISSRLCMPANVFISCPPPQMCISCTYGRCCFNARHQKRQQHKPEPGHFGRSCTAG